MERWPTRGFRTGMASNRPVLVAWWWLRMPWYPALRPVLDWFTGGTPVWYGGRSGGVVGMKSVDAQLAPMKDPCLVEGRMPYIVLISGALTLDVSRGSRLDVPSLFPSFWHIQGRLMGKAAKRTMGRVPVSFHASRDRCVRWEIGRCIKCPGSRARVRRRTVSLRSTSPDSLERASVFDGGWRSSPDRFARRYFCLRGCGRRRLHIRTDGASNRGPRLTHGWSRYMHWWGYPLLIPSTLFIKLRTQSKNNLRDESSFKPN